MRAHAIEFLLLGIKCASLRTNNDVSGQHSFKAPDISPAKQCLELTTHEVELIYPKDAEAHFQELQNAFSALKTTPHCHSGYCGPWIENDWINTYTSLWQKEQESKGSDARLSSIFGPYIPIFVQFVDYWVRYKQGYLEVVDILRKVLRPDVPYITVSQNDEGLVSKRYFQMSEFQNLLVLSAGGYGHVPVPLYKQLGNIDAGKIPMKNRKYIASYMGSPWNAPHKLRQRMCDFMDQDEQKDRLYHGQSSNWRDIMRNSKVQLVPRGFGRTAYHLVEVLQTGLVPVHVYSDIPWMPYKHLAQNISFVTHIDDFPEFLKNLENMDDAQLDQMETEVVRLRNSHFTREGVMQQIADFMKHGTGALQCEKLPSSIRHE